MRVSSRFCLELLPRALRLSWHSFPETRKNIYEALIWQTINIISSTLTWTHNSHREVEITNKMSLYFYSYYPLSRNFHPKWPHPNEEYESIYFPWERWNKTKQKKHQTTLWIESIPLCVSVMSCSWMSVWGKPETCADRWNTPQIHSCNAIKTTESINECELQRPNPNLHLSVCIWQMLSSIVTSSFVFYQSACCLGTWDHENHQPTPENTSKTSSKHNLDRDGSSCDI